MPSNDPGAVVDSVFAIDDFDGIPVTVIGRLSLLSRLASSYQMGAVLYVEEDESPTPRIRYTGCIRSDDVDMSILILINEVSEFNQGIKAAHLVLESYFQRGIPFDRALVGPMLDNGSINPSGSGDLQK
jgi:hypothetical protein